MDDIIQLRGDRYYRQEIVRTMVTEPAEARKILTRMDKFKEKISSFDQSKYMLYSEAVRLQLRKKGGLE